MDARSTDRYSGFAQRYDFFPERFADRPHNAEAFFATLFARYGVRRMLDCACGTGRDLLLFHSLGCHVVGSDLSPSMLAKARENLATQGVDIPLVEADYRDLPTHFGEPFDAVVCLSTSIAEVPSDIEALTAFRSMRNVLRDGGILVLDQGTTDRQWRERPRFILSDDTPQVTRIFVIDYVDDRDARYTILDVNRDDGHPSLHAWSTKLHLLLREDQERLLSEAGFAPIEFFGGYGFAPYDDSSRRLIAVATK